MPPKRAAAPPPDNPISDQGCQTVLQNEVGSTSVTLALLKIGRYQVDPAFNAEYSSVVEFPYVSDLFLADVNSVIKVFLDPAQSRWITRGLLYNNSIVKVTSWKTIKSGPQFHFVKAIQVTLSNAIHSLKLNIQLDLLQTPQISTHREQLEAKSGAEEVGKFVRNFFQRPMFSTRTIYLHPIYDDIPYDKSWISRKPVRRTEERLPARFCHLSDLQAKLDCAVRDKEIARLLDPKNEPQKSRSSVSSGDTFIIVRVVAKSQLTYYGNPNSKISCPYKFSLLIVDASNVMVNLDFWNESCLYYYSISPGDILKVSSVRIRQPFQTEVPTFPNPKLELTYNPKKGEISCSVLEGTVLDSFENIPTVSSVLSIPMHPAEIALSKDANIRQPLSKLMSYDTHLHSVYGRVIWIGPIERIGKPHWDSSEANTGVPPIPSWRSYRWITIHRQPVRGSGKKDLHIFATLASHPDLFSQSIWDTDLLACGSIAVYNVRLVSHHDQPIAISTPYTYITSNLEEFPQSVRTQYAKLKLFPVKVRYQIAPFPTPATIPCDSLEAYKSMYYATAVANIKDIEAITNDLPNFGRADFVLKSSDQLGLVNFTFMPQHFNIDHLGYHDQPIPVDTTPSRTTSSSKCLLLQFGPPKHPNDMDVDSPALAIFSLLFVGNPINLGFENGAKQERGLKRTELALGFAKRFNISIQPRGVRGLPALRHIVEDTKSVLCSSKFDLGFTVYRHHDKVKYFLSQLWLHSEAGNDME